MEKEKFYQIDTIEVIITDLDMQESCILNLHEPTHDLVIPIIIGKHEGRYVLLLQEKQATARPITHKLINNICDEFSLKIEKVVITKFFEGIFYSTIYINDGFSVKTLDSRTSDAVAIALAGDDIPIYVTKTLLDETGVKINNKPESMEYENLDDLLKGLEKQLAECEKNEEFEKAAEILSQIELLKKRLEF